MRPVSLAVAALTLSVGPWLGLPTGTFALALDPVAAVERVSGPAPVRGRVQPQAPRVPTQRLSSATGCGCREVVVNASNVVRDAEIRTGDATVVNKTITYIAPTFGDDEVEVDQEAEARSGDAIAGQILAVNGGEGCSRVRVTARNVVEDTEVRSGDAIALNKSVILLDPSIAREDLEIEVDQEAVAESGDAVAGQIIGVQGGGPCGGVILDALNRVREVELRTGETRTQNLSDILTCENEGCLADIKRLIGDVESVDVCGADGCETVPIKEFIKLLKDQTAAEDDGLGAEEPDEPDDADENDRDAEDAIDDPKVREAQPWRFPKRKPSPSRAPATEPPAPTPTPEPTSS